MDLIEQVERAIRNSHDNHPHELARVAVATMRQHLRRQLDNGEHTDRLKTLTWLLGVGEHFGYCTRPGGGPGCWLAEAEKILTEGRDDVCSAAPGPD
jgi:hypothetical protein